MKASPDCVRRIPPSPRLADEKGLRGRVKQAGRVKLEELHVRQRGSCPVRHGYSVARRDVRVAGVEVDLAGAAGREQRDRSTEGLNPSVGVEHVGAERAIGLGSTGAMGGHQVYGAVVFEDRDVGVADRAREQRAFDCAPGGVPVVQDAPTGVTAFASQLEVAGVVGSVEVHSVLQQRLDRARTALDDVTNDVLVAQPVARAQRVLHVVFEGIVVAEDGRDPALGPVRGGIGGALLGDDRHSAVVGDAQREEQPGDSTADHQEVEAGALGQAQASWAG
jgi:hypothetical protein